MLRDINYVENIKNKYHDAELKEGVRKFGNENRQS